MGRHLAPKLKTRKKRRETMWALALAAVALIALLTGFTLGLVIGVHWKGRLDDERFGRFCTELEVTADQAALTIRENAIEQAGRSPLG